MFRAISLQPINRPAAWTNGRNRYFSNVTKAPTDQTNEEPSAYTGWTPAVNVLEKEDTIVIAADLPGLKAEDVEVTIENSVLTLKGERTFEEAAEGETYHCLERCYGSFERSFKLPNSVDSKKIEARFVNGEMIFTLPKRDESKPRSVKVKVATS